MRLTQLTAGHQDAVLEFERANRDYFAGFITDRGDAFFAEYPARHAALLAMQEAGTDFFHLIVADDGATILGRVNLVDVKDGEAELGYRVGRDAAGHGVATEAVRQVCELAVGYGLRRLRAETSPDNHASRKVLLRNGFTQDGDVFTKDLVASEGTVFAVFDRQDSGCLSYGVQTGTDHSVQPGPHHPDPHGRPRSLPAGDRSGAGPASADRGGANRGLAPGRSRRRR